jgi:hypothetical protein
MNKETAFQKAFSLTGWFETDGEMYTLASGNFDKQGLSWGPRQNCIGQGSLQPLMRKMLEQGRDTIYSVLGPVLAAEFEAVAAPQSTAAQLERVNIVWNTADKKLKPDWVKGLAVLGRQSFVQKIFQDDARSSIAAVDTLATWMAGGKPVTMRIWAVAYDFVTQNGGFNPVFRAAISTFLTSLKPFEKDPRDRLRALCWLRAGWTGIRGQAAFAQDVLGRKLLIVEGHAKFRGKIVDVDEQFGISDEVVE